MNEKSKNQQGISNNSDINESEIKSIKEIFHREVANLKILLKSNKEIYTKELDKLGGWKEGAENKIITLNITLQQNKENLAQIINWKDASERRLSALENTDAICRKDIDNTLQQNKENLAQIINWKNASEQRFDAFDNRIKELEKWRWIQTGIIIALGAIWTIITVMIQIFFKSK